MNNNDTISTTRRHRLEEQGFRGLSDEELARQTFGIRFAYYTCGSLVLIGLALKSMPLLLVALGIAFLGMFPPYHPFDYLYNGLVRHVVGKPKLVPRANQARFACAMATALLAGIVYSLFTGFDTMAYILGAILLGSAFLVSVFDICIPSKIYNALFGRQARPQSVEAD